MDVVLQEEIFETVQTLFCEAVFLKLSVLVFFRRKIFFPLVQRFGTAVWMLHVSREGLLRLSGRCFAKRAF